MSILNDLIAKVSALTAIVNQLTTNSKTIQELPAQETLNPDSLIHVSKDNTSKKITVQQIINAAISNQNDQIISIGTITLSGNDLTISDISAKINNVIQSISLPTIINIPFCASGLKRIDLLVYNTSNEITRIAGTETSGAIVVAPTLPINCLLITQISVTDSVISEPQPPILGNNFLQKEYEKAQVVNTSGNAVVIPLNIKGRNNIILNGALTGVTGFSLTNLDANPASAEHPHEGKDYYIQNKTGHAVTLKNFDTTVDIPFLSKDGNDILVPNNGIVFFKNSSNVLQEIFRSYDSFDISLKADLVAGKVPSSQLPSYVDDVLEFANLATFPVSGEASKIYLALDTNFTYRWSSSVYLKISDTGKLDKVTTVDVEKVYIKNADGTQGTKPTSDFGTIKGTGTNNSISKFTASGTIGDSQIFDDGTNVGIGTTSPTTVLDVQENYSFNTGTVRPLKIVVNSSTTTVAGFGTGMAFGLKIGSGSVEDVAYIDVINTETWRSGEISFKVSQGSTPIEAVRINYLGNVGIGTTSPQARLDVRAQGVFAGDIAFRVRNSTDTKNFLVVNGAGDVYNNGAGGVNTNTFFGENVGRNTTGNYNTAIGVSALQSNAKGDSNTAIGVSAGRLISNGSNNTITNNSIFIGVDTRALANNQTNQIVIGDSAIGLGSNSVVLGNTSITITQLRGQVIMGAFDSAPTGIEGAIYYDSTTKKHRGFNGTAWTDLY